MQPLIVVSLLAALLTLACGSIPQTHYYTIGRPLAQAQTGAPGKTGLVVGVPRLEAEGIYARDNLLYRSGGHEITPDYYRRWGVPPQKMLAEAMIDYLRAGGAFGQVLRLPSMSEVDLVLAGRILRFEQVQDQVGSHTLVNLEFILRDPGDQSVLWRSEFSDTTLVGAIPSAEAVVAAFESSVHSCLKQAAAAVAEAAVKLAGAK
ncbi:MAG: membrane integrity-associated transporter subunit PqiC [Candidatus Glassbacteria bacterium]|nr:membrane integrity-associated transporter subunit PqiC [Candidatus Glassbacteria bacterium]